MVVLEVIGLAAGSAALSLLIGLILLVVALTELPLGVRRLHDTDKSGWWLLLGFIPLGGLVVLVFMLMPGTPAPNRFG